MRRKKLTWYEWFLKSWLFFLFIWLFIGFALGTLILFSPVRFWVNYVKENDLGDSAEKGGVIVLIILLVIASFIMALKIFRWRLRRQQKLATLISIVGPLLSALGAVLLFMNPDIVNSGSETSEISQQFTIGPYPTESKILQLKSQGYSGIISLLHPAVVPFEPTLIEEEKEQCRKRGIELISAPMLPWIGDNSASLNKIEKIVRAGKGKYYIHCYLGKDRVNVVKNLISKINGSGAGIKSELGSTHRTFEQMKTFERGVIYKLDDNIYMTPYPTNEEFLSFFLAGKVKTVVNIMDASNKENLVWINKEQSELKKSSVDFRLFSIKDDLSVKEINQMIGSILILTKPIVIHRWNTTSTDAKLFRKTFSIKTGRPVINLATNVPETY